MRPLWAGEGLDLITSIEPAALIVESVIAEAIDALARAGSLLDKDS
jgi:hypothetical protein